VTSSAWNWARPFVIVSVGGASNCWQPGAGGLPDFNPASAALRLRSDSLGLPFGAFDIAQIILTVEVLQSRTGAWSDLKGQSQRWQYKCIEKLTNLAAFVPLFFCHGSRHKHQSRDYKWSYLDPSWLFAHSEAPAVCLIASSGHQCVGARIHPSVRLRLAVVDAHCTPSCGPARDAGITHRC